MKTYEIWQMIDKAENKELVVGKRFKTLQNIGAEILKGDIGVITEYCKLIGLGAEKHSKIRICDLMGFEEWEQVQEPVEFMAAINSGKHIKPVELTNWNYREPKDWLNIVSADSNWLEYINGKWEIE